jgi:type VI protein secretion system component Hcp
MKTPLSFPFGGRRQGQFPELLAAQGVDKSSPRLKLALAQAEAFPSATLEFIQPGGLRVRFYQLRLSDVW